MYCLRVHVLIGCDLLSITRQAFLFCCEQFVNFDIEDIRLYANDKHLMAYLLPKDVDCS